MRKVKIMTWNANGLHNHLEELQVVLDLQKIDVCLISETHFTKESYFKLRGYNLYHTAHPLNTARGGSAVIIKQQLQQYEEFKLQLEEFQVTSVKIRIGDGWCSFAAIYSPPRHSLNKQDYLSLLQHFQGKFVLGGDFNAKNTEWGSNITSAKGRELLKAVKVYGCKVHTSGQPTYWPTDVNKRPDLIDFYISKHISTNKIEIYEDQSLSSDHSPVVMYISDKLIMKPPHPCLTNKYTDWELFSQLLNDKVQLDVSLKSANELEEDVETFVLNIQEAAWEATTYPLKKVKGNCYPEYIRDLIAEKRKIRKRWQTVRYPSDKVTLNRLTSQLRTTIMEYKQDSIQTFISELTTDASTDYSLWKMSKKVKKTTTTIPPIRNGTSWARNNKEKAAAFAEYLEQIFQPHEDRHLLRPRNVWDEETITPVTPKEVQQEIKHNINSKKAPGFDLISGEVLKQLPRKAIVKITNLINASFRLKYVPRLWKTAEVVMIPKPGKDSSQVQSYRPISLLPVMSKLYEKLLLKRLKPVIEVNNIIPLHQFGFRNQHSTLDQVHRITNIIEQTLEERKICAAVFLDVAQAFDRVWHDGLFYKLNKLLPPQFCALLESYLTQRTFRVRQEDTYSELRNIGAGVPQGSVLGPLLYLVYTYDLPQPENAIVATFADDTAVLAIDDSVEPAINLLQSAVNSVSDWAKKWQIKLNESKSSHVNFTNKKTTYVPVIINNQAIPFGNTAKYLGMTLDAKLRWKEHVKKKRVELGLKYRKLYWLLERHSSLSIANKLLLYKQVLRPVWTYGIQLWGCTKPTNMQIIQTFQNKVLRNIVNAPWYIRNSDIHRDLQVEPVTSLIQTLAFPTRKDSISTPTSR